LKIADFGTVRQMDNAEYTKKRGTIFYMAPEVFNNSNYTTKCDVYSFGITLCEMFTREKPYSELKINHSTFIEKISKIDSPLRPNSIEDTILNELIERYLIFCLI
jgi:serine/threonine protein kinase